MAVGCGSDDWGIRQRAARRVGEVVHRLPRHLLGATCPCTLRGSDVLFLAFACAHATGARAFEEVVMSAAGMIFDWDMGLLSL